MSKEPLLFLCHRIPFPPNKGDKITTFNLLKYLSSRYEVHLGCFVDDTFDRQYISELDSYCVSSFCLDICERSQLTSGIRALLKGKAVSTEHYHSQAFQDWVDNTIVQYDIERLLIYSSGIAQFVDQNKYEKLNRIVDMADIDSDKWRQYAEKKPWYSRWIYQREQKLLAAYEQHILDSFDATTFITEQETQLFKTMSPDLHHEKIYTLSNGVDTKYFDPDAKFDLMDLPRLEKTSISFTGAMDYWANVDAVVWFCQYVWPKIVASVPGCHFYIVGGKPPAAVKQLEKLPGVVVTGRVPDVRPYVVNSPVAVAPMRIARGVQNKVLEAMSLARPVVMTSMGQEGIELDALQQSLVIDEPERMAEKIIDLLSQPESFTQNRLWIEERYSWEGALRELPQLLEAKFNKRSA